MIAVLGFTGKKRSGKTTAAKTLCDIVPASQRLSFAAPLKKLVFKCTGLTDDDKENLQPYSHILSLDALNRYLEDHHLPRLTDEERDYLAHLTQFPTYVFYRKFCQTVGTDIIRRRNPQFWIQKAEQAMEKAVLSGKLNIIFDDIRFENEANFIRKFYGKVILIKRPTIENNDRHVSEIINFQTDEEICNDATLDDFKTEVKNRYISFFMIPDQQPVTANYQSVAI